MMNKNSSLKDSLTFLPHLLALGVLFFLYAAFGDIRAIGSVDDVGYVNSFENGFSITGNFVWNRWIPVGIFSFFEALGVPPRSLSNLCFFLYVPALLLANYLLSREILGDRKCLALFFALIFTCNITWISLVSFLRLPLLLLLVSLALSAYAGLQDRKSNNFLLIFLSTLVISLSYQSAIYVMVCFVLLTLTAQYVRNDDTDLKTYVLKLVLAAATMSAALIAFFIITKIAGAFVTLGDERYQVTSFEALAGNVGRALQRVPRFLFGDYLNAGSAAVFNLKTVSLVLLALSMGLALMFSKWRIKLVIATGMLVLGLFVIVLQPLQLVTDFLRLPPRVYGFFQYLIFGSLAVSLMVLLASSKITGQDLLDKWIGIGFSAAVCICALGFAGQLMQIAEDATKNREREKQIAQTVQSFYVNNQIEFEKPIYVSFSSVRAERAILNSMLLSSILSFDPEKSRMFISATTSLSYEQHILNYDVALQEMSDTECRKDGTAPRQISGSAGGFPRVLLREMDEFVVLCLDGPS